jgi:hypothetical protein
MHSAPGVVEKNPVEFNRWASAALENIIEIPRVSSSRPERRVQFFCGEPVR